ncbi:hypothetical protein [Streptomyces xanthochromogenes]|uniref:hypothetical protein n=1 Tax=Streptomyces xanthochromogenes TaxID=67384 RepID=UPI003443B186
MTTLPDAIEVSQPLKTYRPAESRQSREAAEIDFVPAVPAGPKMPGRGWLQSGGLIVHTGWSHPRRPERADQPLRQHGPYEGRQSWRISTPDGHPVAAFDYFTREDAEQAAAVITATLPDGIWPRDASRDDHALFEQAFDASTGPDLLPHRDERGRRDWGFGAAWISWRIPPTRSVYQRMIAKHGGAAPTKACYSCRKTVREARRAGWTARSGHWPAWGAHPPGYVNKVHCSCAKCIGWVTIGAVGITTDAQGRTVPSSISACTYSHIQEDGRDVPFDDRPWAWWRHMVTTKGHVIMDSRPCAGLWPIGVRHDDAFLCETGISGTDTTDGPST